MKKRTVWISLFIAGWVASLLLLVAGLIWFHYPFQIGNLLYIACIIFFIYSGFFLAWLVKGSLKSGPNHGIADLQSKPRTIAHRVVMYTFAAIFLAFVCSRFAFPTWYPDIYTNYYRVLPLNVCNIVTLVVALKVIYRKNRLLDNYILCFGILGAITNLISGSCHGPEVDFFTYRFFESSVFHNMFFTYCIYVFYTGECTPNVKYALLNAVWMFALYVILCFTNQIWEWNFMFNSRYGHNTLLGVFDALPIFYVTIGGFAFEMNLVYWFLCCFITLFVLLAVALLWRAWFYRDWRFWRRQPLYKP